MLDFNEKSSAVAVPLINKKVRVSTASIATLLASQLCRLRNAVELL